MKPSFERRVFVASLLLKLVDAVLEMAAAIVIWIVRPTTVSTIAWLLTRHELAEDPHDFIARHVMAFAARYSDNARHFAAFYLASHGIVKAALIIALFKRKLWAYPMLLAFLVLFMAYQCYRLIHTRSVALVVLTVFDAIVAWLVWREYRRLIHERPG